MIVRIVIAAVLSLAAVPAADDEVDAAFKELGKRLEEEMSRDGEFFDSMMREFEESHKTSRGRPLTRKQARRDLCMSLALGFESLDRILNVHLFGIRNATLDMARQVVSYGMDDDELDMECNHPRPCEAYATGESFVPLLKEWREVANKLGLHRESTVIGVAIMYNTTGKRILCE